MKRLAAVLGLVAAAVIGGLTLPQALRQEANCQQWDKLREQVDDEPFEWFAAVAVGFAPPTVAGNLVIGECNAQGCRLDPQGCPGLQLIGYRASQSGATASFRLWHFKGPKYFARAWKELAAIQPASVKFLGGWGQVKAQCAAAGFSAAQCRTLISDVNSCWKRSDGQYCNNGRLYGPGVGGVTCSGNPAVCVPATCTLQAADVPSPCTSEHGPGWAERVITEAFPSDAELEQ